LKAFSLDQEVLQTDSPVSDAKIRLLSDLQQLFISLEF